MSLPKLMHPTFELTVPSSKQKVRFRPFLVKEEKILLMAKEGDDKSDIINVLKQVISNCDVDSVVNTDKLASFDLEYLFLKLRGKSVNNVIELSYTDMEDEEVYNFSIDVDDIQIVEDPKHSNIIKISDTSGIVMRYPTAALMSEVVKHTDITNVLFHMIRGCMDNFYDGDNISELSDVSTDEMDSFIENLPAGVLKQFEEFFNTMPRMYYKIEYVNKNGTERTIELRTIEDFFILG
jgi:T4 bacteriophage base plate protein